MSDLMIDLQHVIRTQFRVYNLRNEKSTFSAKLLVVILTLKNLNCQKL